MSIYTLLTFLTIITLVILYLLKVIKDKEKVIFNDNCLEQLNKLIKENDNLKHFAVSILTDNEYKLIHQTRVDLDFYYNLKKIGNVNTNNFKSNIKTCQHRVLLCLEKDYITNLISNEEIKTIFNNLDYDYMYRYNIVKNNEFILTIGIYTENKISNEEENLIIKYIENTF